MYKVNARTVRMSKVSENYHSISLIELSDISQRSLSIIETAEITEKIHANTDCIYYVLDGVMTIDGEILKKGECCFIKKGDSIVISGTFRTLSFT